MMHVVNGSPSPEAFGVNLWHSSPAGFTLIEMLATLLIIVLLAGLIIGTAKYASTKAATSRAQSEIAAMELALEQYKNDNGVYPAAGAGAPRVTSGNNGYPGSAEWSNSAVLYTALATGPKVYYTFRPDQIRLVPSTTFTNVIDPFGNPYNYYNYPTNLAVSADPLHFANNTSTFDLWSYGPNGRNDEGTNDDITNWRR